MEQEALYPFGYGLHYGSINYSKANISSREHNVSESIVVSCTLKNNSSYLIHEIIQVYVSCREGEIGEAKYQLKNIVTVSLQAEEEQEVTLKLSPRDFARITNDGLCVVEPGSYQVFIGGQQPDSRSKTLTGDGITSFDVMLTGDVLEVEF